MQLIPVIDLKAGQVVHAIAGRRHEYGPVESVLSSTAEPASVARGMAGLGATVVYVADLDALAGAAPDWPSLQAIAGEGLHLWVDVGVGTVTQACHTSAFERLSPAVDGVVVALESVADPAILSDVLAAMHRPHRALFSLDLREGRPMGTDAWNQQSPVDIAALAFAAGFRRMIVLDLARVGVSAGPPTDLVAKIRAEATWEMLATGGGVRDVSDLEQLAAARCDAALVATALHRGAVGRAAFLRYQGEEP